MHKSVHEGIEYLYSTEVLSTYTEVLTTRNEYLERGTQF
jgi:hypothetical protein